MSEIASTSETQTAKLQEVLDFINRPDEVIVSAGYKEAVLKPNKQFFLNSDVPAEVTRFEQIKAQLQAAGMSTVELVFTQEIEDWEKLFRQIGEALKIPDFSKIDKYELIDKIDKYLKGMEARNEPIAMFFRNADALSIDSQTALRGFLQHIPSQENVSVFVLGSKQRFEEQFDQWGSSPLRNILRPERESTIPRFDAQTGKQVIGAFREALNLLKSQDSAEVAFPSKSGKSSFSRLLLDFLPEEIEIINLQNFVEEGQKINLKRLPGNLERNIVLVDEAQLLSGDQKVALTERYGKVVFIENSDFVKK